jgi:hypothetical protein
MGVTMTKAIRIRPSVGLGKYWSEVTRRVAQT